LVSLAVLAFTSGCGSSSGSADGTTTGSKEITVYTFAQPTIGPAVVRSAADFQTKTGVMVNVVAEADFSKLQPTLEDKAKTGSSDFDVYVSGNLWVADFVNLGYAEPLDPYLAKDAANPELALSDIPKGVTKKNDFGGSTYSMLVDNDNMNLFYRKDVFADPKWQAAFKADASNPDHKDLPNPPTTLSELLQVAKFFQGKDWNPDVDGETSFVTATDGQGQNHYYVMSWAAPYTVMPVDVAPSTGLFLFKPDMTPLVNSTGFVRGVTEWKEIIDCCTKSFGDTDGANGLLARTAVIEQFIQGQALMAIDWGDIGPAAFRPESVVAGKIGFAMSPGADQYYNWQTSKWVRPAETNFAPVHQFNGWSMYLASTSKHKDLGWDFIRYFSSPDVSIRVVADPTGGYQPWRTSHSTNLPFWVAQGWVADDAQQYVQTILQTTNHPNRVIDIRIPGSFTCGDALESALLDVVTGGMTPQDSMDALATRFDEITDDLGRAPEIAAGPTQLRHSRRGATALHG
jgi:multiple sugar transport system substrate-binding protein